MFNFMWCWHQHDLFKTCQVVLFQTKSWESCTPHDIIIFLPILFGEPRRNGKCFQKHAHITTGEGGNLQLNIWREAWAKGEIALEIHRLDATPKGEMFVCAFASHSLVLKLVANLVWDLVARCARLSYSVSIQNANKKGQSVVSPQAHYRSV